MDSSYSGGFNAGLEIGFPGVEGGFAGGEQGYTGAGVEGGGLYDYDSDVASMDHSEVVAEERTNFG